MFPLFSYTVTQPRKFAYILSTSLRNPDMPPIFGVWRTQALHRFPGGSDMPDFCLVSIPTPVRNKANVERHF